MDRKSRTVLCLGPPHSGKSVFAFVLFKYLRQLGNDACIMDCDYYSPTFRRTGADEIFGQDDNEHIYATPSCKKLEINEYIYSRLAQAIFDTIVEKGIIVLDGIGRHTKSTEALLTLTNRVIVLCSDSFNIEIDADKCHYLRNQKGIHPFDFYSALQPKCVRITTYYMNNRKVSFDPGKSQGELFDLDRNSIHKGNIEKIPEETRETILRIAKFILDEWV